MSHCLVTGGAGFIGSHIVEALLARGDEVRVLDNLTTGYLHNLSNVMNQIEFIEGDVKDETIVNKAAEGIELVFHLAAMVSVPESMTNPIEAELRNAVGTLNVLNAARSAGVRRLVLSSTCAVYGDEPTLPKTEAMPLFPKSPYAVSKLAAEGYCQVFHDAFGLETVVLRYFNVFGPRQDPSSAYSGVISIFVDRMSKQEAPTIFGDGEQTRDFVFVKDVALANMLASEVPEAAGKLFNVGTGRQVSINQLFTALCEIFKCELRPEYKSIRAGDILHSYADPTRANTILNWTPQVSFENGLVELVHSIEADN